MILGMRLKKTPPSIHLDRLPSPVSLIPMLILFHAHSFPHVMRIPSIEWIKQAILSIYFRKIRSDAKHNRFDIPESKKSLPLYIHEYFTSQYGLSTVADTQIMVLMHYMPRQAKEYFYLQSNLDFQILKGSLSSGCEIPI
jgi:hypothetical protein